MNKTFLRLASARATGALGGLERVMAGHANKIQFMHQIEFLDLLIEKYELLQPAPSRCIRHRR
jgi:hypothetical protein